MLISGKWNRGMSGANGHGGPPCARLEKVACTHGIDAPVKIGLLHTGSTIRRMYAMTKKI